jgi:hypothetical protein
MTRPVPFRSPLFGAFVAGLLLVTGGCGGDSGPKLVDVSGKVLLGAAPLTKGGVRFVPDKSKGNTAGVEPVGTVGSDGSYSVSTNGKIGAPLGWYKVAVNGQGDTIPDSSKPNAGRSPVGPKYADPETSGLSVEVVASPAGGAYDLKVSAK